MSARLRFALPALIALAAAVPLLNPLLPQTADGRPHLLRLVALDALLRDGLLWPRFDPHLAYGYGYPLFNYYAPLTYYLGAGLHALGLDFVPALHTLFGLALLTGAAGAFALAEDLFGDGLGAAAAAAAYAFAPYTLFNLFARGAAPEALALGLLPWLVWGLRRALDRPSRAALIRLFVLYAGLLLLHNLTALIGTALILGWLIVEWRLRAPRGGGRLWPPLFSLGCGLAATAFFWLPAVAETGAVQIGRLTGPATLDFRNYFLALPDLLRPPFVFDPLLEGDKVPVAFGLPQAALGLAALALIRRHDRARRTWIAAIGLAWLGLLGLTLNVSQPIWELLAPLGVVQFPWRFLGPASLLGALLAGSVPGALAQASASGRVAFTAAAIALCALNGLPWTYVNRLAPIVRPDLETVFNYEIESQTVGLTSTNEFLPAAVRELPAPERPRASPGRLDPQRLPEGVRLLSTAAGPLWASAEVEAPRDFEAVFNWFDFPGWRAEIDGAATEIRATDPHGLIAVEVPAGRRTLRVWFGSTPLRRAAESISVLALLVFSFAVWRAPPTTTAPATAPSANGRSLYVVAVALVLVRLALGDGPSPFNASRFDGQGIAGAQPLDVNFGDRLILIGAAAPPATLPADQTIAFDLYWRPAGQVDRDYSVTAQLRDERGFLVGQHDSQHPGGRPTSRWSADGYARDAHGLRPFAGTPPGNYRLMIAVYSEGGGTLEAFNADGLPLGRFVELARVALTEPTRPPTDLELNPSRPVDARLGGLRLVGVDLPRAQAASGDALPFVFYWRSQGPASGVRPRLDLIYPDGAVIRLGEAPIRPLAPGAAARLADEFTLPPDAPAGAPAIFLSAGQAEAIRLGALVVTTPARSFDVPSMDHSTDLRFGDGIALLGYSLSGDLIPGQALEVRLYWRSLSVVPVRYAAFVHLVDAGGAIVSQSDATPGQGLRPTTGWLPPEVIIDPHRLDLAADLPPGDYTLHVGLVDPRTGERLPIRDAAGAERGGRVLLGPVAIK